MKKTIILILGSVLLMPSCMREDRDDCASQLRIVFEWEDTEPRDDQERVQLSITPVDFSQTEIDLTSDIYGRNVSLRPQMYRIVAWETAENVTVTGDTVTLATGTDGYALQPQPFSGGDTLARVYRERLDQVIPVPMHQQTRPLCVRLFFTGNGMSQVEGVEAVLEGVTLERLINNGFPPVDRRVRPPALRNGNAFYSFAWNDTHWYATQRLIGIDGDAAQKLNFTLLFNGGHTQTTSLDVTGDMFGYHTRNIHEPWCITVTIDLSESLLLTITDWYAGEDSWLVAE